MSKQQLTLEQARHNYGYSIEQVSQITGIPADTVKQCEANGMKAGAFHVHVLLALYKIDLSHVSLASNKNMHLQTKEFQVGIQPS